MAQQYLSYGYLAFEAVLGKVVEKRVVFAISRTIQPQWLSWYVFVEHGDAKSDTLLDSQNSTLDNEDMPNSQGWDKINVFGSARPNFGTVPFTLNAYIDVNQFAGFSKQRPSSTRSATLNVFGKDKNVLINMRILLGTEVADLAMPFDKKNAMLVGGDTRRSGTVWLLGSTKFTPSALGRGPVSTAEAGSFTPYDRHM